MTKDELFKQVANLVTEYEVSNNNNVVGCYLTFEEEFITWEYNGQDFKRRLLKVVFEAQEKLLP
jgi:deoxycytidylate deaminase